MALFRTPSLEVVFLHLQFCDRIGSRCPGDQCILFFVVSIVWHREHTVGLWRQVKQVFDHRDACRDMRFVDHQGGISADLTARFAVSGSPVRVVVSLCDRYPVLPDLFTERLTPKSPRVVLIVSSGINCSMVKKTRKECHMENKLLFIGALGAFFLATAATLVSDMHGIGDWLISSLQSRKYALNPAPIYAAPYTIAGYFGEPLLILSIAMLTVGLYES